MDNNEIIKALVLIRDICASEECNKCPFRSDIGTCCITAKGSPAYWEIDEDIIWRAFK